MRISIPELSFVLLVGPSGSGKTTFARRHFRPTEVLGSDQFRALLADDENDQTVSEDAFEVLYLVARKRLASGRLTVLDATNIHRGPRQKALRLAREHDRLTVAIVFDLPESELIARHAARGDRDMTPHEVREQVQQLRRALPELESEGLRRIYRLGSVPEVEAATVIREPL